MPCDCFQAKNFVILGTFRQQLEALQSIKGPVDNSTPCTALAAEIGCTRDVMSMLSAPGQLFRFLKSTKCACVKISASVWGILGDGYAVVSILLVRVVGLHANPGNNKTNKSKMSQYAG